MSRLRFGLSVCSVPLETALLESSCEQADSKCAQLSRPLHEQEARTAVHFEPLRSENYRRRCYSLQPNKRGNRLRRAAMTRQIQNEAALRSAARA